MARRVAGPWFRGAAGAWYATRDGKAIPLGVRGRENEAAARLAWHRLMSGAPPAAHPVAAAPVAPAAQVAPPAPAPQGVLTVKELFARFLEDVRGRATRTTSELYAFYFRSFAPAFLARPAAALTPYDAESAARRPTWSTSTRYGAVGAIVAAFKWAERAGLLAANPVRGARKPPKTSRGARAVITPEQHRKLCDAAPAPFRLFLRGLWLTGARPGELAAVTAADVDLEAGVALLALHKTVKVTGKPRALFLSPDAVELFRDRVAARPSGPLFPRADGRAWLVDDVVTTMRRVRRNAGVPTATAYGYRHSYATHALARGVPDAQVAALLGHQGTNMLHKHYSHLTQRAALLREAAAKVRGAGE